VSDHPRDCPHGRQWGKCDTCDLLEAQEKIAALEAEVSELLPMADVAGWWQGEFQMANVDRNELRAENERLRAVAGRLTKALNDCIEIFVVFDTDAERVIAIEHTVNAALAALDEEVGE
jgi:hypothetical protein